MGACGQHKKRAAQHGDAACTRTSAHCPNSPPHSLPTHYCHKRTGRDEEDRRQALDLQLAAELGVLVDVDLEHLDLVAQLRRQLRFFRLCFWGVLCFCLCGCCCVLLVCSEGGFTNKPTQNTHTHTHTHTQTKAHTKTRNHLFELLREQQARPAPRREEVDDHRRRAPVDRRLELLARHLAHLRLF